MRRLSRLMFLILSAATIAAAQDTRTPVPNVRTQREIEATIREIYKDDFARCTAADRNALAKKLHDRAIETKDNLDQRYVLLCIVLDLTAHVGDGLGTL